MCQPAPTEYNAETLWPHLAQSRGTSHDLSPTPIMDYDWSHHYITVPQLCHKRNSNGEVVNIPSWVRMVASRNKLTDQVEGFPTHRPPCLIHLGSVESGYGRVARVPTGPHSGIRYTTARRHNSGSTSSNPIADEHRRCSRCLANLSVMCLATNVGLSDSDERGTGYGMTKVLTWTPSDQQTK